MKQLFKNRYMQILLIASIYYLFGIFGTIFNLPRTFAAPVWPSIGIGIAGLLIYGYYLWPGIFIAALALNFHFREHLFSAGLQSLMTAAGVTLAVTWASFTVRRIISFPKSSYNFKEIFLFLLIVGPITSLISASVGSASLLAFQVIGEESFYVNWLYWWIGDSIGGILFAPLAIILSSSSKTIWMRTLKSVLLPLFAILAVVVFAIHHLNANERNRVLSEFDYKSRFAFAAFEQDAQSYVANLNYLQSFFENSKTVTAEEFRNFSEPFLQQHFAVRALAWLPAVTSRKDSQIRQLGNSNPLEGALYPITIIEPDEKNRLGLRIDFTSEPRRRELLERASKNSDRPSISVLNQQEFGSDQEAIYMVLPVRSKQSPQQIRGFLLQVIQPRICMAEVNNVVNDLDLKLNIKDGLTNKFLGKKLSFPKELSASNLVWAKSITLGGHPFIFEVHYNPTASKQLSVQMTAFLITLLIMTFLISLLLLTITNRIFRVEALVDDKTEHLKHLNRRLEQISRTKSEFLANMSHEIRTPLNAIIGVTDILAETELTKEQESYVEMFKKAGHSLLTIISDILDISKIEAGLVTLESVEFNVIELVKETAELYRHKTDAKGLKLTVDIDPTLPAYYWGDPTRVRQILNNLLSNAVKFTSSGSISIWLHQNSGVDTPGTLRFVVMDTGIGISPEKTKQLFKPFSQADATITRRYGGTGLGLSITKRLVEMMNGTIWVDSQPQQGSSFFFTLDLPEVEKPTIASTVEVPAPPATKKTSAPLRILIVDDNEDNILLLRAFLKNRDFILDEAENGQVALDKYRHKDYDLILMDMQMPVMDGYTASRLIREEQLRLSRSPVQIWALTAYAMKDEIDKTLQSGCNRHLIKPLRKSQLIAEIDTLIASL